MTITCHPGLDEHKAWYFVPIASIMALKSTGGEKMGELLFGPAGVPLSAKARSTEAGIERVAELGLGCMELEFVQGVRMGKETALAVGETAKRLGVALSAHGPYFINLNATEPDKVRASQERILQTARIAALCGARSIVFHAAFYLDDSPERVYEQVKSQLQWTVKQLRGEGNRVWVRPEVTGKGSQFGTLEEVLRLSAEIEGVAPCIDFAHWHARTGEFNSYDGFTSILKQVENRLGRAALDDMHIHVSGIAYSRKGESRHLNLKDSDFNYVDFIKALCDFRVRGLVVSESPNLEGDALLLQETYRSMCKE
jgi:deoxyribonuclease-4